LNRIALGVNVNGNDRDADKRETAAYSLGLWAPTGAELAPEA
jgi:hypothetical protein